MGLSKDDLQSKLVGVSTDGESAILQILVRILDYGLDLNIILVVQREMYGAHVIDQTWQWKM